MKKLRTCEWLEQSGGKGALRSGGHRKDSVPLVKEKVTDIFHELFGDIVRKAKV